MVSRNGHGFDDLHQRFAAWRQRRSRGTRIPELLWRAAVKAARAHGVSPTSRHLGVDYYALARRLTGKSRAAAGPGVMKFVEVPGPVLPTGPAGVVELQDDKGRRLRVEVRDAGGVEPLARSLWKRRR